MGWSEIQDLTIYYFVCTFIFIGIYNNSTTSLKQPATDNKDNMGTTTKPNKE